MSSYPDRNRPAVDAFYQREDYEELRKEYENAVARIGLKALRTGVGHKLKSGVKNTPGLNKAYSFAACLKDNGWGYTKNHFFGSSDHAQPGTEVKAPDGYSFKIEAQLSEEERKRQEGTAFDNPPLISVLTPLYNTPITYLKEMIESVQNQTYPNWELCLSDCSEGEAAMQVETICLEYAEKDSRIRYLKTGRRMGISENTNSCIDMASGDFFALLDHDDILHPAALFEIALAAVQEHADFIYSDEAKFEEKTENAYAPNFKPDFAPDELRTHNYICHLTAYSRALLEKCGRYRPECDGSQDHDMVLRLTEQAEHVVHIPKVLYFWRVHKGSVSAGIETKSYAVEAAKRAVADQVQRMGMELDGEVECIPPYPSLYKIPYAIDPEASVTVLVYNTENAEQTWECVRRLDVHELWHHVKIVLLSDPAHAEELKKVIWKSPCAWPLEVSCEGLKEVSEKADSEFLLTLDASVLMDSDHWFKELAGYAQREDVGFAGGIVWNTDGSLYDAGGYLMKDGTVKKAMYGASRGDHGYEAMLWHPRNTSCLSGAVMLFKTQEILSLGGIDEEMGEFWPEDLCLRARKAGKLNVVLPYVTGTKIPRNAQKSGEAAFQEKYRGAFLKDPYLNPNLENIITERG